MVNIEIKAITLKDSNSKPDFACIDQIDNINETDLFALGFPKKLDGDGKLLFNGSIEFDINNDGDRDRYNKLLSNILEEQNNLWDTCHELQKTVEDLYTARKNCRVYKEFENFTSAICSTKLNLEDREHEKNKMKDLYKFFDAPWSHLIAEHDCTEIRIIEVTLHHD